MMVALFLQCDCCGTIDLVWSLYCSNCRQGRLLLSNREFVSSCGRESLRSAIFYVRNEEEKNVWMNAKFMKLKKHLNY